MSKSSNLSKTKSSNDAEEQIDAKVEQIAKIVATKNRCSKSWVFTLNNYTQHDCTMLDDMDVSYMIYGREISLTTGTPHLQGFITFKRTYRLPQLKKLIPEAHWEIAKAIDAGNYCLKDKKYTIRDNRVPTQRDDLQTVSSFIVANHTLQETALQFPTTFIKFSSGIEKLYAHVRNKPRTRDTPPPLVVWLYGETGVGKTRSVREEEPNLWVSEDNLKWFTGYENQEAVLLDDFRPHFCSYSFLLRLLDRYSFDVQVKYGSRTWNPKRIYITAPSHPSEMYECLSEDIKQLLRRITWIVEVATDDEGRTTFNRFGYNRKEHGEICGSLSFAIDLPNTTNETKF